MTKTSEVGFQGACENYWLERDPEKENNLVNGSSRFNPNHKVDIKY